MQNSMSLFDSLLVLRTIFMWSMIALMFFTDAAIIIIIGDEAAIRWDCPNLVMKWSLSEQSPLVAG